VIKWTIEVHRKPRIIRAWQPGAITSLSKGKWRTTTRQLKTSTLRLERQKTANKQRISRCRYSDKWTMIGRRKETLNQCSSKLHHELAVTPLSVNMTSRIDRCTDSARQQALKILASTKPKTTIQFSRLRTTSTGQKPPTAWPTSTTARTSPKCSTKDQRPKSRLIPTETARIHNRTTSKGLGPTSLS